MSLLLVVLGASFAQSLHCAGMCGGLVAFYTGTGPGRASAHAAYSAGRLVAYATLGAVAGALGALVDAAGVLGGAARPAALFAGGLIVLWGLLSLARALGLRVGVLPVPRSLSALAPKLVRGLREHAPWIRASGLGLATGFIPCGFLYAFVLTAAATGDARLGGLLMVAFWLGTLPVMLGVAAVTRLLSEPLKRRLPLVSGLSLVAFGLLTLAGRVGPGTPAQLLATQVATARAEHAAPVCHGEVVP